MIIDRLENASLYQSISSEIDLALRYLQTNDLSLREPFKEQLSDTVQLTYSVYDTVPPSSRRWSAHNHITELQYVVEGVEKLGFSTPNDLQYEETAQGKDILYFSGEGNWLRFAAGQFAVLFRGEVHIPKISIGSSPTLVRKAVFKITAKNTKRDCKETSHGK